MRVTPCMDPANVRVAPNSPRQRASARAAPRPRPGRTVGRVICQKTREGEAPREEAISSSPCSRARSADSRVTMRKGRETKTWAMTTAVVVKAMSRPAPLRRAPRVERLPKAARSAMPATTGGSESGRATRMRAARTPRHERDRTRAAGTPRRRSTPSAMAQVRIDRPRASRASAVARVAPRVAQLTRPSMKARGRSRKHRASAPRPPAQMGRGLTAGVRRDVTCRCYFAAGVKPASSRTFWPSAERTRSIHFWPRSFLVEALTRAIGYLLTASSAP